MVEPITYSTPGHEPVERVSPRVESSHTCFSLSRLAHAPALLPYVAMVLAGAWRCEPAMANGHFDTATRLAISVLGR